MGEEKTPGNSAVQSETPGNSAEWNTRKQCTMGQQVDIKKNRKKIKVCRFIAYVCRSTSLMMESYSVLPRGTHKTRN